MQRHINHLDFYVFGHNKEEWHDIMCGVMCELRRIHDICRDVISGKRKPTRGDLSIILNAALKFHSGDGYYASLEGGETIDSSFVGAMVFEVIDKYFSMHDVSEMLFGGNPLLKEEFVNLKERTHISTSGCMRFLVPH